ncbi:hypothetical protein GCM10010468_05740 [Actinocorallia longicatena]|uniref:Uncharacterized protein n=1 Tax=Actinocorallia longicatena TaxID=111803 RepID=A0ABP6PZ70_9ACTN
MSLWTADGTRGFPIGWRLALPDRWEDDPELRRKVGVPGHLGRESITDCAIALVEEARPERPVVASAPHLDVPVLLGALARRGIPFLVRAGGGLRVHPTGETAARFGSGPRPAERLAALLRGLSRPAGGVPVLRIPVLLGPLPMDLLTIWADPGAPPQVWLTDLAAGRADLVSLAGYPAERRSSQASAVCAGVAPSSAATSASAPPALACSPVAMGKNGMNAIPAASAASRTGSWWRADRLYRFCTALIGATSRALARSASVASDSPMCRTFPSARSCSRAPIWSSSGTAGSMRCSRNRSIRSRRSRRRLSSACWRRYSGRPSGIHSAADGPGLATPALVTITRSPAYGWSASAISSSLAPSA